MSRIVTDSENVAAKVFLRKGTDMRKWWPLVAICLGTFMLLVDMTIVNVALPTMARSLHSSFSSLQWVIDGYALALAALLMVAGSLADRFGRRRLHLAGLAVFALTSLTCGLAPNVGVLIAGRIVQGAGGAAMFATTAALISTTYQGRQRGTAFGVWGAVNGLAASSGPLLGGLLIQAWSWRAIVLVDLPLAALAILMTAKVIKADTAGDRIRIDLAGATAFTLASISLVYALIQAGPRGWGSAPVLLGLAVAAAAAAAFVVIEHRVQHPMLSLSLFANHSFSALMIAAAVLSGAAFAYLALVSVWLQTVLGLSPIRAGLAVIPLSLASFVVSAAAARFLHRVQPAVPIAAGLALNGVGLLLLTLVGPSSGAAALLPGLIVDGIGVGLATPVLVSESLSVLPPAQAGIGGAARSTPSASWGPRSAWRYSPPSSPPGSPPCSRALVSAPAYRHWFPARPACSAPPSPTMPPPPTRRQPPRQARRSPPERAHLSSLVLSR